MNDSIEEIYPDLFFDGAHVTVTIYGANMTFLPNFVMVITQ